MRDDEFEPFAIRNLPRLRRIAFVLVRDWSDADDVVQETFERLAGSWHRINSAGVHAYSRRILFNVVTDLGTKKRRRRTEGLLDEGAANTGSVPLELDILSALKSLSPTQQKVLLLRYYEDMSIEDTAKAMACSRGNVKRVTFDALRRLRDSNLLSEEGGLDGSRD